MKKSLIFLNSNSEKIIDQRGRTFTGENKNKKIKKPSISQIIVNNNKKEKILEKKINKEQEKKMNKEEKMEMSKNLNINNDNSKRRKSRLSNFGIKISNNPKKEIEAKEIKGKNKAKEIANNKAKDITKNLKHKLKKLTTKDTFLSEKVDSNKIKYEVLNIPSEKKMSNKSIRILSAYINNLTESIKEENNNDSFNSIDSINMKKHIQHIINMLKFETNKSENYKTENLKIINVNSQLIDFCKKLLIILEPFLKNVNPQLLDELNRKLIDIRYILPKNMDPTLELDESIINKKRTNFIRQRGAGKKTTFFNAPRFSKVKFNINNHQNSGIEIVKRIREKGNLKNFKNFMSLKLILKTIYQLYEEKLNFSKENIIIREQEMQIFVFNTMLNKYGIKKVAENKFTVLCLSIINYLHIFRINVFAKMMNLLDESLNYSVDEIKKYFEGMDFLMNICNSGISISYNDYEIKKYVPYIRTLEYLKFFSENKMSSDELNEIKREVDFLKENDHKNINKLGIVDMDIFLSKILNRYRLIINRTKDYVVNAFTAADLDGNKMCDINEFILLYRHIERNKFNEEIVIKIFEESADLVDDNEKKMSFNKFAAISVEHSLFSDNQQNIFLEIEKNEEIHNFYTNLRNNWVFKKEKIEHKLDNLKENMEESEYQNWVNILSILEIRIVKENNIEQKPILIAYKVMEEELDRILEEKHEHEQNQIDLDETDQQIINEIYND